MKERNEETRLDLIFHALADGTRRRLLARLTEGPAMIGELAAPFAMSRPAISKHLRVLEAARLVSRVKEGRIQICAFEPASLRSVEAWLNRYRIFWDESLERLSKYMEKGDD
ncbi:MAG TPA: metalloregulator ArsR/SmtB family transcription factor [Dongiaceae bacterium]|nr:metalloregulator ArsR/SmtB family transcription factor [Dongiaceae bacterium]